MVKLTEEQKRQLEALDKIPDDEIDFSDIPLITDWSGFKMGLFYRPKWKDFSFNLDEDIIECLDRGLSDGQTLDDAVNKALGAQMYRIRFPIRVQKAEKTILRIQESPQEVSELTERQIQEIEILYARPVAEVAYCRAPLKPMAQPKTSSEPLRRPVMKEVSLNLDENVIDWFEVRLEEGRTLDENAVKWFEERLVEGQTLEETINMALLDHIRYISFPDRVS